MAPRLGLAFPRYLHHLAAPSFGERLLSPRRRFVLVHNPTAGLARRPLLGQVLRELERRGAEVVITSKPPHEALAAPPGSTDAVIAAGGDGTIRALAAAAPPGLPIGIIPVGTGNVLACEIGLSLNAPVAIADVLMHGPVVEIEGAVANGQPFYLMAGVGFDGAVVARLDLALKRRIGKAAYVGAVLGALRAPPVPLDVSVDGKAFRARWVVAANARSYGGAFMMAPRASLLSPGLEVVLMQGMGLGITLRQLAALGLGRIARARGVTIVRARTVRITSEAPVAAEVDGDVFGTTPLDIAAGGPRFPLIVPPDYRG